MYVITAEGEYITRKNNVYQVTTDPFKATTYPIESHAKNAFNNLPKFIKAKHRTWDIVNIDAAEGNPTVSITPTPPQNRASLEIDIISVYDSLTEIIKNKAYYTKQLGEEHALVEAEICDIQHYIELKPTQELTQGYNLYSMLRQALLHRREIKDKLYAVNTICNSVNNDAIKDSSSMHNNRIYTPRQLIDLFATDKIPEVAIPQEAASDTPKKQKPTPLFDYNGEKLSVSQLAKIANIPYTTMYNRLMISKMPVETAVTTPKAKHARKKAS